MDEVTKEIRQILIGNIIPKGRYYEVPEKGIAGIRTGLTDGADMILLFGVARHTRYYKVTGNPNKIKAEGHRSLMNIGRKVIIRSNPDAEVSFCRYMVTRPIVILFEVDDIGAKVETYTARGISGLISEAWIRWKFMKELPELERIDRNVLNEIYRKKAEEEKKAKEEQKKAEEEARKKEEEEKKKAEEERKKQEALDAIENAELSDEEIEEIIASRRKKKKDRIENSSKSSVSADSEDTAEETSEEIPEISTHRGGQKKPGLRGVKKRFKRAPKLSDTEDIQPEVKE